jgi:hypothetical protein
VLVDQTWSRLWRGSRRERRGGCWRQGRCETRVCAGTAAVGPVARRGVSFPAVRDAAAARGGLSDAGSIEVRPVWSSGAGPGRWPGAEGVRTRRVPGTMRAASVSRDKAGKWSPQAVKLSAALVAAKADINALFAAQDRGRTVGDARFSRAQDRISQLWTALARAGHDWDDWDDVHAYWRRIGTGPR